MRLRQVVGVLAFLLVASAVVTRLPSSEAVRNRPFERRASVGLDVSTRSATYQVTRVEGGKAVSRKKGGTLTTNGVLLVITIWHAGVDRPSAIPTPRLRDSQRRVYTGGFHPVDGWSTCTGGQPILGQTCQLVFEVAPDWLAGAELRLPVERGVDGSHDEVAVIELGITQDMVIGWLNPAASVTVTEAHGGRP